MFRMSSSPKPKEKLSKRSSSKDECDVAVPSKIPKLEENSEIKVKDRKASVPENESAGTSKAKKRLAVLPSDSTVPLKLIKLDNNVIDGQRSDKKHVRKRMKSLFQSLVQQMEFYFSDANLLKDRFLKNLMDKSSDGYVDLSVFSNFNKLQSLHKDGISQTILVKALKTSKKLQLNANESHVKRIAPLAEISQEEIDNRTVYVEDIPSHANHTWIRNVFSKCGNVVYISLPVYKTTKQIKEFAFVEFETAEEASKACQLNNPLPSKAVERPGKFPKGNKDLNRLQRVVPSDHKIPGKKSSEEMQPLSESAETEVKDKMPVASTETTEQGCSKKKKKSKKKKSGEDSLKSGTNSLKSRPNSQTAQQSVKKKKKKKKRKGNTEDNTAEEKKKVVGDVGEVVGEVETAADVSAESEIRCKDELPTVPTVPTAVKEENLKMDPDITQDVSGKSAGKQGSGETDKTGRPDDPVKIEDPEYTEVKSEYMEVKSEYMGVKSDDKVKSTDLEEHKKKKKKKKKKNVEKENSECIKTVPVVEIVAEIPKLSRKERKRLRQEDIRRKKNLQVPTEVTVCAEVQPECTDVNNSTVSESLKSGFTEDPADAQVKCERSEITSILKLKKGQEKKKVGFDPVAVTTEFHKGREIRKRKKPKKNKLHLRVISKKEWLSLKAEYINQQKSHVAALKESLRELRQQETQGQAGNKLVDLEEVFGNKRLKTSQEVKMAHVERLKFIPNVIVQWKCSYEVHRDKIKTMFKEISGDSIAYIDAMEEAKTGYVRFKDEASAEEFAKMSRSSTSFMARVLPMDQQEAYWTKANEDRLKKLSGNKREKGADKIARKVFERNKATFNQKATRIVFAEDETGESTATVKKDNSTEPVNAES